MSPRKYDLSDDAKAQRRAANAASAAVRAVGPATSVRLPIALVERLQRLRKGKEPLRAVLERLLDLAGG